jgi:thymidylate synthase ThyX
MRDVTNAELRKLLGTNPHLGDENAPITYFRGCEGIKVRLVATLDNPYRAMYTMAVATWGPVFSPDKWEEASVEARVAVVLAVLNRQALPLALEAPQFVFEIQGPSRSAFDQVARARIGATFASMGWRDNCHTDIGFRVPTRIYDDPQQMKEYSSAIGGAVRAYRNLVDLGQGNWQNARAALPISACHRWVQVMNYAALQNFCSKRLSACEQEDTVGTAWMIREAVRKRFPLLAEFLRPGCDFARRCTYHNGQEIAESFGALFRGCGRWPSPVDEEFALTNESCTDYEELSNQLKIAIPGATRTLPKRVEDVGELSDLDHGLFCE